MKMLRKLIVAALIIALAVGLGGIGWQQYHYRQNERAVEQAQSLAKLPSFAEKEPEESEAPQTEAPSESQAPETDAPESVPVETAPPEPHPEPEPEPEPEPDDYVLELLNTDLSALQAVNPDVFGWIMIPDSTISYPLLQGEDNAHYLTYAWNGWWNPGGSIYLDYRSSKTLSDFHSIVYGHRMYNDSMFNSLKNYSKKDYWEAHPQVYILTADGVHRYNIFAAYDADVKGHSYRLGLTEVDGQQALFQYCLQNSVLETGIVPSAQEGDRLLTLSTCSSTSERRRWVVHAVLEHIFTPESITE